MNRRVTIGLVVVFAALAVYVLLVQVPKDKVASASPTAPVVSYLWSVRADQINGVHIVDRVKSQQLDLVKDAGGAWTLVHPGPQPADQATAATDVNSLSTLALDGTITTATDLTQFGVLSPTYTIEVDVADGSKLKAVIGDKAPTGSDAYVLREGEKQVVLLSSASLAALTGLVTNPPVVPPTATATVPTPGPGTPSQTPLNTATSATTTAVGTGTAPPAATGGSTSTAAATLSAAATATSAPVTATPSLTPQATLPSATTPTAAKSSPTP